MGRYPPLHMAVCCDFRGFFPLHHALSVQNFEVALLLLREHVGELDASATAFFAPLLHEAVSHHAPDDFMSFSRESQDERFSGGSCPS